MLGVWYELCDPETWDDRDSHRLTYRVSLSGTFLQTAKIGYATEGALFVSAQLSTDAVSALEKVWVLIRLWKQHSVQTPT